jgi:hypothetical protein
MRGLPQGKPSHAKLHRPLAEGLSVQQFQSAPHSTLTAQRLFLPCFFCTKSLPAARANVFLMIQTPNFSLLSPVTMGKYRIAACPRPLTSGRFEAQVSIASGRGSASTDRVMRFCDDFSTHDAAAQYALAQGIDWVHEKTSTH